MPTLLLPFRDKLDISDSVLSKHLKRLDTAGYVKQRKVSENGRKRSWAYLTTRVRKALESHVAALQELLATR